jgi:L-ascorbate metabolism protein UlaG (beta-lactamase superfamily)
MKAKYVTVIFHCCKVDCSKNTFMIDHIAWLGHASFALRTRPLLYINPWRLGRIEQPADIILISDSHHAHCSPADVNKLRGAHTRIIGSESAAQEIEGVEVLRPWQSVSLERGSIRAIATSTPGDSLGFIISLNFYDIYYTGDTKFFPEMASIHPDIVLIPVDDRGTFSASEAAQAVTQMSPRWAIPYNWELSSRANPSIFEREVDGKSQVVLLTPQTEAPAV